MIEDWRSFFTACAALGAVATLQGCAARAQAQNVDPPPLAVAVESAAPAGLRPLYRGPGTVVAAHTYRIGFEISGRVTNVGADLGDRVAAGQILASLDDADARRQVDVSAARAASAQAQAARAERGSRPEERVQADAGVESARAAVARAQAAADLAHLNAARERALEASGDVATQQADAARTAAIDADQQVAAARAQLAAVQQSAALVSEGPRSEDRAAAVADARAAWAAGELARIALDKTALRAPADGYVESRAIEPGDIVQPGAVAFVLTSAEPPDIVINVPEARLAGIDPGTRALVSAGGAVLRAHVTRIEPAADEAAHATQVRVRLDRGALRAGAVVDVALGARAGGDAAVATGALLRDGAGWAIETYDAAAHEVRRVRVRVVDSEGARTIVTGVRPGATVVVMGQHDVRPGDRVRIVSAP